MTHSADTLKANAEKALRLMWEHIGDRGHDELWFDPESADWSFVLPTTWARLTAQMYVNQSGLEYQLDAFAWARAEGRFSDPEVLAQRCHALRRALSGIVTANGRQDDMITDLRELHSLSGLPEGWIFNALRGVLLTSVFPDDECVVGEEHGGRAFRVPRNFGTPNFGIFDD